MSPSRPLVTDPPSEIGSADADDLLNYFVSVRPELERFLTARLGDASAAQDVYQSVYFRFRATCKSVPIQNPRAYLYKIAANLARDYQRGARRDKARDRQWLEATTQKVGMDFTADIVDADEAIDAKRRLKSVVEALNELPPKCRRVFVMHKLEGLSHLEVAARLGVSRKAVEKHMTNALKYLTERFRTPKAGT